MFDHSAEELVLGHIDVTENLIAGTGFLFAPAVIALADGCAAIGLASLSRPGFCPSRSCERSLRQKAWNLANVGELSRKEPMVRDIIIALIITVIAVVLGIAVHPVLFFIIVLAVVYFLARHRSGHGSRV